ADGRQDGDRDRAPPVDHRGHGPAGGDGPGRDRRAGHARRTGGPRRHLRPAPAPPVRRLPGRFRGLTFAPQLQLLLQEGYSEPLAPEPDVASMRADADSLSRVASSAFSAGARRWKKALRTTSNSLVGLSSGQVASGNPNSSRRARPQSLSSSMSRSGILHWRSKLRWK